MSQSSCVSRDTKERLGRILKSTLILNAVRVRAVLVSDRFQCVCVIERMSGAQTQIVSCEAGVRCDVSVIQSTKHQAPNPKHEARSTKHLAPSTKHTHQAPSTKHQATSSTPHAPRTTHHAQTYWRGTKVPRAG